MLGSFNSFEPFDGKISCNEILFGVKVVLCSLVKRFLCSIDDVRSVCQN
jgi:putative methionine-R-sulfoxide reductase with GAF domain